MKFYRLGYLFVVLLLSNSALANVPTAEEECRQRNAASCEINGLKFFITEEECPRGAKVLRPRGKERCDNLAEKAEISPTQLAVSQVAPLPASAPAALQEETQNDYFKIPFLVVATIGLFQGLISTAGWGQFIVVGVVMPVLVTWGMVSGDTVAAAGAWYWVNLGLALLQTFIFAISGWGAGLALRSALLKLLHK